MSGGTSHKISGILGLGGVVFCIARFFVLQTRDILCPKCNSKKLAINSHFLRQETGQKQKYIRNNNTHNWEWKWLVVTTSYFNDSYKCLDCGSNWVVERTEESN